MKINRRHFLILSAGVAAGCKTANDVGTPATQDERIVNAGPAGNYAGARVYSDFRDQGFFVVRQGDRLFVLSAICTHRKCKLAAEPDGSYYCKCHGSTFDSDGRVTRGPAKRDLPILSTQLDNQGRLIVKVPPG